MAEYVVGPDEDVVTVARELLAAAGDPAGIDWSPRPNAHPHGGVFVLPEDRAEEIIAAVAKRRDEQAARIEAAVSAALARDAKADETGLTPERSGFPADTVVESDEDAEDAADEATVDDPTTPEDEHAQGADRAAKRRAARKAAVAPAADEQKSE